METTQAKAERLAPLMIGVAKGSHPSASKVQITQLNLRAKLIHAWGIPQGASVLEVGCGQGDTTIVLADTVGSTGKVVAIDIAEPTYGAPDTIGDSMRHIKEGKLGAQLDYHFELDIRQPHLPLALTSEVFDVVVLAQCSLYFSGYPKLVETLKALRPLGKRLCFSEWNTEIPIQQSQWPHFLALMIQAQIQARHQSSTANVRTLFTPFRIRQAAEEAGWHIEREFNLSTPELQDAGWEVNGVLSGYHGDLETLAGGDEKWLEVMRAQIEILADAKKKVDTCECIDTWGFIAA